MAEGIIEDHLADVGVEEVSSHMIGIMTIEIEDVVVDVMMIMTMTTMMIIL